MTRVPKRLDPWWPTARQTLLLRAALLPREQAISAWREWCDTGVLDDVDSGSFRLLPLLYRNLARHNIDEPQLPRLRGVYRQAWYRNQLAMEQAHEAVRMLADHDIPVMILKGAALLDGVYGEMGARPMEDVDLMVPRRFARRALRLLGHAGWASSMHRDGDFQGPMRIVHGVPLHRPNGLAIDLHWRLLDESPAGHDSAFWDAAEPFEFGGARAVRLCPSDQILHLAVHGIRWDPIPPIRWSADLYLVLQHRGPEVDWERLVAQAVGRGLTLELLAALTYVRQQLGAHVPDHVLRELRAARPSRLAYLDFRAQGARTTVASQVARYVTRYARLSSGQPMLRRFADAPFYLQELWGLERARDVPVDGARRVAARIRDVGFRFWRPLPAPASGPAAAGRSRHS